MDFLFLANGGESYDTYQAMWTGDMNVSTPQATTVSGDGHNGGYSTHVGFSSTTGQKAAVYDSFGAMSGYNGAVAGGWFYFDSASYPTGVRVGLLTIGEGRTSGLHRNFTSFLNSSGYFELNGGIWGGGTLGTSLVKMCKNTWYYIEQGCYLHATAGWYYLRVNDVLLISATGVNTTPLGSNPLKYCMVGYQLNSGTWGVGIDGTLRVEDVWFARTNSTTMEHVGVKQVKTMRPSSDGTYLEWNIDPTTPTTHWDKVAERYGAGSMYVWTDVHGERDTYFFSGLSGVSQVDHVQVSAFQDEMDGHGTADLIVKRGGSENFTTFNARTHATLSYHYADMFQYPVDPLTSSPWTVSNLSSTEFGTRFGPSATLWVTAYFAVDVLCPDTVISGFCGGPGRSWGTIVG